MDTLFGGRTVDPVSPAAPYLGGKRNLARRVVRAIDAVTHDGYAEAFVGMGGIFFRRRHVPKVEIINDLSGDVAGFFRILQRHYIPFLEMLRYQITSRREFERLAKVDPSTLTDLERAARFLYLQRTAYGGKVTGRSFGVDPASPGAFDMRRLGAMLEAVHERLAGVVIENLPYQDLLARYDRPGMLFYLDPPYFGCETDYGKDMFGRADFARLAEILGGLEGTFILSINDAPEVRGIFEGFALEEVVTTYQISGEKQPAAELIIRPAAPATGVVRRE
ncbi:DNA adenine methylase [Microbaculum marinisediminis]|uniref:site-specific DNA-methyltransferase (adenine-specific) n=1 Tax=Microbaculum marinisediminis TaxID=2931392 RepID=A0AAW5QUI4_9HYPH|nr:DNA adenine methylase [Microbaculum sp. A6E488]MCT8970559.1 DNA adenine methylase [Microbaculum sp. A6E488]